MYDTDMHLLYEFSHVSRLCRDDENHALAVLDLDYIQQCNWLVVSSNDHLLTFWSVVNATTGAFVFAFKIGSRCPLTNIQWCGGGGAGALNRLFTVSSEGIQLWDVEAKRVACKMNHHSDRITACVEVIQAAELPMLATCSFDATIALLHVPSLAVAYTLVGHVQAIQRMEYNPHCGLLLSSGFEHEAYCWSLPGQCLLTKLGGHRASLIGARFVSRLANTANIIVVVGDERGHFRLWDISRCYGGHSTDLATALQSFDIVTPNLCKFSSFVCVVPPPGGRKKKHGDTRDDLVDIVSGSFRLYRFHAVTHSDEFAPPLHVIFNSVSNCFVGSVDGVLTVWSGNSGVKLEEPITIRNNDVCAIAFDMPRQRKLFVATSVRPFVDRGGSSRDH
jgi:WD40 repeat protein